MSIACTSFIRVMRGRSQRYRNVIAELADASSGFLNRSMANSQAIVAIWVANHNTIHVPNKSHQSREMNSAVCKALLEPFREVVAYAAFLVTSGVVAVAADVTSRGVTITSRPFAVWIVAPVAMPTSSADFAKRSLAT